MIFDPTDPSYDKKLGAFREVPTQNVPRDACLGGAKPTSVGGWGESHISGWQEYYTYDGMTSPPGTVCTTHPVKGTTETIAAKICRNSVAYAHVENA